MRYVPPLNAIVGFSSVLAATDSKEEKQEFINIIHTNNQLLLQLISDILDLSKIEAGALDFSYSDVELNELMDGIRGTVPVPVSEKVSLVFVAGAKECHIITDRNRFSQVMFNFISNAIKFTEKGTITYGYELRDTEVYIYVKDTGCGIPEERQKEIFRRFVKLNAFSQGTGLGLSICKSIVETMQGQIGFESHEGEGSCFWFTLPYNRETDKPGASSGY